MTSRTLTIAMMGTEVAPFSKAGGLADVMGSLPKALRALGHHVIVFTPFYEQLIDVLQWGLVDTWAGDIAIDAHHHASVRVLRGSIEPDIPVYFIGSTKYFSQKKSIYGSTHDNSRFFLFSVAALDVLVRERIAPDIIHCHDWHTGLIPYLLKHDPRWSTEPLFAHTATLYTIHNLAFQMGKNWWDVPEGERDDGSKSLPPFHTPDFENIN
ncbi:glycogen/starch synthase, partial [Candidatus Uhrbacteria bacterium]|nr:glycogen/starch synthase [Candidatus Uhrbacteria bacterium]